MSVPLAGEPPWQRLDPRMLLVHPVTEIFKFLPVLVGLLVAGGASGTGPWALLGVGLPVGLGVVRYLTTTYRVTDARVELRRGASELREHEHARIGRSLGGDELLGDEVHPVAEGRHEADPGRPEEAAEHVSRIAARQVAHGRP